MKAPLLIQIENGTHTVQTFANRDARLLHIEQEESRCRANGLKMEYAQATRQPRPTDVLVIYRGSQPAPMPSRKTLNAILKQYKEDAR